MYRLTQEGEQAIAQLKEESLKGVDEVENGLGNPWALTGQDIFLLKVVAMGEQYTRTFDNAASIMNLRFSKLITPV